MEGASAGVVARGPIPRVHCDDGKTLEVLVLFVTLTGQNSRT